MDPAVVVPSVEVPFEVNVVVAVRFPKVPFGAVIELMVREPMVAVAMVAVESVEFPPTLSVPFKLVVPVAVSAPMVDEPEVTDDAVTLPFDVIEEVAVTAPKLAEYPEIEATKADQMFANCAKRPLVVEVEDTVDDPVVSPLVTASAVVVAFVNVAFSPV